MTKNRPKSSRDRRVGHACYTQSVGLLGLGISPSQGLHLHTEQHKTQNKRTQYRHPCLEWDSNPRSQRSSEQKEFMPWTARPL
jgi:hypothetical protein